MNPICTECGIIMSCRKNGYVIGFMSGRRYDSDLFGCKECGGEVAIPANEPHPDTPMNGVPVYPNVMMREDQ